MAIIRIDSDLPTLVDLLPKQAKVQRRVMQALERLVGRRRFEMVYFNPRELLAEVELEAAALARTLRELRQLKSLDYIPPFRGRAIHLLDTSKKFSELEIDFELLDQRKAAEYEKLRQVIGFAQGRQCRQAAILDYFGEAGSQPCGHCDNCSTASGSPGARAGGSATSRQPQVASDEQLVEVVRMTLAGVARSRGRFGKHLIAQMLCGSSSAKITRFGLQRLSTYGLLKPLKQTEVAELLDALVAGGWLEQVGLENHRPLMQLSELGRQLMAHPGDLAQAPSFPAALAARLRLVNTSAARPQPPREVTPSNRRARPTDDELPQPPSEQAFAPPNSGQAAPAARRVAASGDESARGRGALGTSADCPAPATAPATAPGSAPSPARSAAPPTAQPAHYWTWRLLAAGFSVDECAAIRNLEREVVLDHSLRAMDEGWRVEIGWFLSPQQVAALEQLVGPGEPQRLRPLLSQLPPQVRYEELQLYLKCRRLSPGGAENLAESKKSPQCGTIPA
jgi:ATP-dependent DNA helicase RecQ